MHARALSLPDVLTNFANCSHHPLGDYIDQQGTKQRES